VTEPARPPTDGHPAFHQAVVARVHADRDDPGFPGPALDDIAAALRRRTTRSPATNLASHLRALDIAADVDVDAPVASARAAGRGVKVAVQRLTGWYVGHLAGQVRQLGVATARALRASVARVDELERRVDALEERTGMADGGDTTP
jgi:hypothetical protein